MADRFIALDWGTTSFRAYLADASGTVRDTVSAPEGILAVADGRFEEALEKHIGVWDTSLPVMAAGMITSRQGWIELPYLPCPASAADLAGALRAAGTLVTRRAMIVVVSDFLATEWERPLRGLAARHEVTAITLDDARESELPSSGWVTLEGVEHGRRVLFNAGDRRVRARAQAAVLQARQARSATLAGAGVREVRVDTAGDYLPALRAAFGRGKRTR